jgi:hypothetical protein
MADKPGIFKSLSETQEIRDRTKPDAQQDHVNDLQFESLEQEQG